MANITQTITQFPPAPDSVNDTPQEFNQKANAFVGHQSGTYVGEVNQWAIEANAVRDEINNISSNLPDGAINDAVPSDTNTFSSNKIISMVQGFKNHIINGGFNIWQRGDVGTVGTTSSGFTADRWTVFGAGSGCSWSINNTAGSGKYISLTYTNATTYGYINQKIEGLYLAGETVTLSYEVNPNSNCRTYPTLYKIQSGTETVIESAPRVNVQGGGWTKVEYTFTIPQLTANPTDNTDCYRVGLFFNGESATAVGTNKIRIRNVQLEIGSVATPFEQRPYGLELSLCQRYYYNTTSDINLSSVNTLMFAPIVSVTTAKRLAIYGGEFPVTMRDTPAVRVGSYSNGAGKVVRYNNNAVTLTVSSVTGTSKHKLGTFINTSELPEDTTWYLGNFDADAEL